MSENKKKIILFDKIEAGMGHMVGVEAIYDAMRARYNDVFDIRIRNVLRESGNPRLVKHERHLIKYVKKYSQINGFGGWHVRLMFVLGPQNTLKITCHTAYARQVKAMVDEYAKIAPDVIVTTHFFSHYCAIRYKRQINPNVKVVCYCPDNNVHGWWDVRGDVFYVNNEFAAAEAYKLGFTSGKVKKVFYPTREAVLQANESKEFYRDKFAIPRDKFAVAITDNVYKQKRSAKVCRELMKTDLPITLCLLTGNDDNTKKEFDELKDKVKPNVTLLTFAFTHDVAQLYAACDLFVTKAGPNAVLDSVMMKTPVLINYHATPIERKTRDLFVKHYCCGLYEKSPAKIRETVENFIRNPESLRRFDEPLAYFDKSKNGSSEVADDVAQLAINPQEHRKNAVMRDDEAIDRYFALFRPQDKQGAEKFKRKFHSGKGNKQFAAMLSKLIENERF